MISPASRLRQLTHRVFQKLAAETFRHRLPSRLWGEHQAWLATCKGLSQFPLPSEKTGDPVFELSQRLRRQALDMFKDKYSNKTGLRILIHVPPAHISMGGYSLFMNWVGGIRHMGVPCEIAYTGELANDVIEKFRPSVFVTSDHESYLRWIDWPRLAAYRERNVLALALTASAEQDCGLPAGPRLKLARNRGVDFFVSFREREYIVTHLSDWLSQGYDVLSIPFSANPTWQFHVPFDPKPLDYVFLASINTEKAPRYWRYFSRLLPKYRGVINGPGWKQDDLILKPLMHPYLYALGAIGINLHIPVSLDLYSEINERTFILACCGTFQLCDSPQALRRFFPEKAVPSATTPSEYSDKFQYYLKNPDKRKSCQIDSLKAVYSDNTIFHRMTLFLDHALEEIETKQSI